MSLGNLGVDGEVLVGNCALYKGVIKLPIPGGIKQYKCMVILSDLLIVMHCLDWK